MKGIFGIGNIYRRDDGIGIKIIDLLKEDRTLNQDSIQLFYVENDVFSIDEIFSKNTKLTDILFIDAMKSKKLPLSTIVAFDPDKIKQNFGNFATLTHNISIIEYLAMLRETQPQIMPSGNITVIGIVVDDLSFKEGISDIINSRIPAVLDLVSEWINNNDITGISKLEK